MKKRTCGTCGHFQESDMSGLGWCLHPQRRVTTDLKIMVRRGELGCRDGWSRDLWAPAGEVKTTVPVEPPTVSPVRPVSSEEMTLLVTAKHVELEPNARSLPTSLVDVVVGETPAIPTTEDRATLLSHDPRAAIEAARKRHLANIHGESREASDLLQPPSPLSFQSSSYRSPLTASPSSFASHSSVADKESPVAPRPINPRYRTEVAPVRPDEVPKDSSGLTSSAKEDEHFSSVPQVVHGIELPRAADGKREVLIAGEAHEDDIEIAPTRLRAKPQWSFSVDEEEPPVEPASMSGDFQAPRLPEPVEEPVVASEWPDDQWEVEVEAQDYYADEVPAWDEQPKRRRWQSRLRFERPSRDRVYEPPADEWDDIYYDEQSDEQVAALDQYEDDRLLPDPAFEWHEPGDPVDMSVQAAPTIPRMCRTCRDFRPADNGGRGWCTNKWAFSHRRMVDADELPCETSLGCWWLPHDEVWLAEADAAAHTEPTPLVDQWLERRVGIKAVSGTRRR